MGLFTAATNVSTTTAFIGRSEVVEFLWNIISKSASTPFALVDGLLRLETKQVLIIIIADCRLIKTYNLHMKLSTQ